MLPSIIRDVYSISRVYFDTHLVLKYFKSDIFDFFKAIRTDMLQNTEYFVKEFLKENMWVWLKLWIELSQRVLVLRHSETVRLKVFDTYYPNFDMSYVIEYSTCKYYIICVEGALFGLKWWFLARFCFLRHIWSIWSIWNVT